MKWSVAISGLLSSAKARIPEGSDAIRFIDEAVKMAKEWQEIVDSESAPASPAPAPGTNGARFQEMKKYFIENHPPSPAPAPGDRGTEGGGR